MKKKKKTMRINVFIIENLLLLREQPQINISFDHTIDWHKHRQVSNCKYADEYRFSSSFHFKH